MKSLWCPGYRHCDIYCLRPRPHVSGHFWIRSRERKILTDAKSGCFFIRWRNNIERSSLPWILYSRWQPRCQVLSRQSKMQILRACFYNACSVANFPSGVLGTRVKPDTCRIRVDGQIRFDHGYVWTWKLLNPERKRLWIQKYPDACGRGRKLVEEWRRLSRSFPPKWRWFTYGHCLVLRNSRTRYVLGLLITSPGMWQPSEL